jgi:hypothetical protein
MTLMTRLMEKITGHHAVSRVDQAIGLSDEVITATRSLRAQIAPFSKENDPFASLTVKTKLADTYQHRAEMSTPKVKP